MYKLTLTAEERRAIDWVGHRNLNGDSLFHLLWARSDQSPDDVDWDQPEDITFRIPEQVAWEIADNAEKVGWPCFSPAFAAKMQDFVDSIV